MKKWDFIVISGLWLVRGSHDFLSEISGDFRQFSPWTRCLHDIFSPLFHYFSLHLHHIYTTNFHDMKFSRHLFTMFSLQILTTDRQTDRDEQTSLGCTDRFSLHIYTTNLHYRFSPQHLHYRFSPWIFTTNLHHNIYTTNLHHSYSSNKN